MVADVLDAAHDVASVCAHTRATHDDSAASAADAAAAVGRDGAATIVEARASVAVHDPARIVVGAAVRAEVSDVVAGVADDVHDDVPAVDVLAADVAVCHCHLAPHTTQTPTHSTAKSSSVRVHIAVEPAHPQEASHPPHCNKKLETAHRARGRRARLQRSRRFAECAREHGLENEIERARGTPRGSLAS